MISGWGFPLAWHSTTAPVPFEKSTRFGGSLTNTGPIDSSSAQATAKKRRNNSVKLKRWTHRILTGGGGRGAISIRSAGSSPPPCHLQRGHRTGLIETVNGIRNFCCVSFSLAYHPSAPGYATPTSNWRVANCSEQQVAGLLLNNMLSASRDHKGDGNAWFLFRLGDSESST